MALLSPGIQLFESSVTPAANVAAASNGVATLGFSSRGPVNKLTKVSSVTEFAEIFGDPIPEYPYAHIMAQAVLANNTDVYFMRLADKDTSAVAACPVVSNFEIKGAKVAIKDKIAINEAGYFMAEWAYNGSQSPAPDAPTDDPIYKVKVSLPNGGDVEVDTPMFFAKTFGPAKKYEDDQWVNIENVLYVSIADVIDNLQRSDLGGYFRFTQASKESDTTSNDDSEIGILIEAKNDTAFDNGSASGLTVSVDIGSYNGTDGTWNSWRGYEYNDAVTDVPVVLVVDDFIGVELRVKSTVSTFTNITAYDHFELCAKYPGSSMNGIRVTKSTVPSSIGAPETWTVTVYDGETVLETRTGITPANFLEEMSKFKYVEINDAELGTGEETWVWKDGSWDLGFGEYLSNGEYWPLLDEDWGDEYKIVKGGDGFPTVTVNGKEQYSEAKAKTLYLQGLGNEEFVNADEYTFSILATPGIQNTMVQNAAINVCATRGDAIYLADVPLTLCLSKQEIDSVVDWANGNSGFQSSYCAIYYGWFAQTNPYDTDNSIMCPASCFLAPKMVALDQSMGEYFAPAGISRGNLICSDYSYSPDQKDRDKLVGNDNVVNPISYSNTRGVTIMAQKTTDRTTSPLNRVGIRRMTNMIKRNLRSRLVALIFEPNNETARARARQIVDDVMAGLRSDECIESYDINVVSGTGANRNDLNVYLSFAPYGLIEKIYVFLNITDAGNVAVTETIA